MAKIIPLRTFASGNKLFYSYDKEPHEVADELAAAWEATGHCMIVEDLELTTKEDAQDDGEVLDLTSKETAQDEQIEVEDTNVPGATETAQDGQEDAGYEAMEYKDLKEAAKAAEIKGYNTMKKADLIAALKGE